MSAPTTDSRGSEVPPLNKVPCPSEEVAGTAGVVMRADIEGSSDFASENRALALRLVDKQFPVQIAPPGGQQLQPHAPSLRTIRAHLKTLLHDRLTLAESVLYQSGIPSNWNLDY